MGNIKNKDFENLADRSIANVANNLIIGIAGYGNIGKLHAELFSEHPLVSKVVIAEPKLKHGLESKLKSCRQGKLGYVNDYKLLQACDAVVIALPTEMHLQAVEYFCNLEKKMPSKKMPLLIEKPLGADLQEADRIISLVRQSGAKVMCGLTGLYHPEFSEMYEVLRKLGRIESVSEVLHESGENLGQYLAGEKGVMNINGIHTLHRFYKIASMLRPNTELIPYSVSLSHDNFHQNGEDSAKGTLKFSGENGVSFDFSLQFSPNAKTRIEYETTIKGENATLKVTGWEKCEIKSPDVPLMQLYEHSDGPLNGKSQYSRLRHGLKAEIDEFIRFLGSDEKEHFTMQEAYEAQKLVEKCYDAANQRREQQ